MKKVIVLALCLIGNAHARDFEENFDYVAFDVGYRSMQGQGAWAGTFNPNMIDLVATYGNRINSYLGYEFGYGWTDRKHQIKSYGVGATAFGFTNNTGAVLKTDGQARFKSLFLDFNLRVPLKPILPDLFRDADLLLSMGVTTSNLKLRLNSNAPSSPFGVALLGTRGRAANHMRLGATLQIQTTQSSGIRLSYRWANTSRLRGAGPLANQSSHLQLFRDSYQATAGLYYLF